MKPLTPILAAVAVLLSGCEVMQYAMENPDTLDIDPYRSSKSFEQKYFRYEIPESPGTLPPNISKEQSL